MNNELQVNFKNDNVAEEVPVGWIYKATRSYTIYQDGRVEAGENYLPDEYELCQYLEGTGSQYIDIGLNQNNHPNIIVEIEGNYTNTDTTPQYIFGASFHQDWNTNNTFILMGHPQDSILVVQNGIAGKEEKLVAVDTKKHVFILDTVSNIGKIDQISRNLDANGLKTVKYNYVIFAQNSHGVVKNNASFKMYHCKITENEKYILNLIPCLDENKVPCMYDSVSKQCLYNKGTGTFRFGQ